jgi:uncharacterized protein YbjT (DUF2867 family)
MSMVLLNGAKGSVGSHVLPALLSAGHDVVALVRSDEAAAAVCAPSRGSRGSRGR